MYEGQDHRENSQVLEDPEQSQTAKGLRGLVQGGGSSQIEGDQTFHVCIDCLHPGQEVWIPRHAGEEVFQDYHRQERQEEEQVTLYGVYCY